MVPAKVSNPALGFMSLVLAVLFATVCQGRLVQIYDGTGTYCGLLKGEFEITIEAYKSGSTFMNRSLDQDIVIPFGDCKKTIGVYRATLPTYKAAVKWRFSVSGIESSKALLPSVSLVPELFFDSAIPIKDDLLFLAPYKLPIESEGHSYLCNEPRTVTYEAAPGSPNTGDIEFKVIVTTSKLQVQPANLDHGQFGPASVC